MKIRIIFLLWLVIGIVLISACTPTKMKPSSASTQETTSNVTPALSATKLPFSLPSTSAPTKPKLLLSEAPVIFDLSKQLPEGFRLSYTESSSSQSKLLGTGSGSEFLVRGTLPSTSNRGSSDWYQIQCLMYVVDSNVAEQTSVQAVLAELGGLTGNPIDASSDTTGVKYGQPGDGLEIVVIKRHNTFVLMLAWYLHPQDNYVQLIPLAQEVVHRLTGYSD